MGMMGIMKTARGMSILTGIETILFVAVDWADERRRAGFPTIADRRRAPVFATAS